MGRGGGDEQGGQPKNLNFAVISLALKTGRPVFCTRGDQGILLANPLARSADDAGSLGLETAHIPGYCVGGPIDSVGAGDSTSAGIACAYAAGASLAQAAAFGNLIASITVQQLGTTGTATPGQVRAMWKVVSK
jgi:sugar/nucleoside kinase (ribokinase family)